MALALNDVKADFNRYEQTKFLNVVFSVGFIFNLNFFGGKLCLKSGQDLDIERH